MLWWSKNLREKKHTHSTLGIKRNLSFLQSDITKIHQIKVNHIWTQISYIVLIIKHIWKKTKVCLCQKEKNLVKLQKDIIKKSQKLLRTSTKGHLFRTFNSYSFNFNCGLCDCRTSYCLWRMRAASMIFEKWPFAISLHVSPVWLKQTFVVVFSDVLYKEYYSLSVSI